MSERCFTPITLISDLFSMELRFPSGNTHRLRPNFAASRILISAPLTARISPPRPISPQTRVSASSGRSRKLEMTEDTMPKSLAGSSILIPPTTLI